MTRRAAFPEARSEIVEVGGAPVGRVVTDAAGDGLRLIDVALRPERRGRGLGTALLRSLQAEARAAGLPLRLSVLHANADARRLYARLGFVACGGNETHVDLLWCF